MGSQTVKMYDVAVVGPVVDGKRITSNILIQADSAKDAEAKVLATEPPGTQVFLVIFSGVWPE